MGMILVKNTKMGFEREMTQVSFDYLSSKKRGFEFIRKIIEPGSIEEHKERLKAEKAEQEQQNQPVIKTETRGRKPSKQLVNEV